MSNVWEARLLLKQLEELANQLGNEQPTELAVLKEQTLRLLTAALTLLRQHRINERGQCNLRFQR